MIEVLFQKMSTSVEDINKTKRFYSHFDVDQRKNKTFDS